MKLDDDSLEQFRGSGLGAASAVPEIPSIHPLPLLPGPDDPRERIDAILRSLHRLAEFGPSAVVCLTGPGDRATVVAGLAELAREAHRLHLRLALEPFQREGIESWSIVNALGDAADLIDEVGSPPSLGIQFDVWHLWNTPDLLNEIPAHIDRIYGVHVDDWREPTRGWADRVLPGDGIADIPAILAALDHAGWAGFYDLEIFSDNGAFGNAYQGSLWDVEPTELAARSRESFTKCWNQRTVTA